MPSSDGEAPRPGMSGTRTAQLASLAEQADLRCLPALLAKPLSSLSSLH